MSISLRDTRGWRCGHRCGGTGEKSPGPAQRPCKRSSLPRNLRLELEFLLRGLECLLVIGREGLHRGPVTRGANTRLRIQHKGLARPLSLYLRSVGGDLSRRSRCCVRLGVCERERGCARESRVPRVPAPVQSGCPAAIPPPTSRDGRNEKKLERHSKLAFPRVDEFTCAICGRRVYSSSLSAYPGGTIVFLQSGGSVTGRCTEPPSEAQ